MCSACGYPPAVGHWTDAGGRTPQDRLRIRFERLAILNGALAGSGLKASDNGIIPGIQLCDATGYVVRCHTLEDVWKSVEALTGKPFDPLAPGGENPGAGQANVT